MDTHREYGTYVGEILGLVKSSHFYQGIAVHDDLTYSVLRRKNQGESESHLVIVARDRTEALTEILGETDTVAEIEGQVPTVHNHKLYSYYVQAMTWLTCNTSLYSRPCPPGRLPSRSFPPRM